MEKTLFLHIGSPKTGTTAIQGFLHSNPDVLAASGVNYVRAGRANASHNSMISTFRHGNGPAVCAEIAQEIADSPASLHVLSSEMFFWAPAAVELARGLPPELRDRTRIICYIRRQDKYIEALYKQVVKNGRALADPMAFYRSRRRNLFYSPILNAFSDEFGHDSLIIRPFERKNFPAGDVINDFIEQAGVALEGTPIRPAPASNKSFSAPISELLGLLRQRSPLFTRDIIRKLTQLEYEGAIRSNDVYDLSQRQFIMGRYAKDNEELRKNYFPHAEQVFDTTDLDTDIDPYPTEQQRSDDWRAAVIALAQALQKDDAE